MTLALNRIAAEAGLDPMHLALAWTLRRDDVFAVPKEHTSSAH